MHLTDLNQITTRYAHVYLAPHFDDAVLSCGGLIAQQQAAGEPVLVVTICTASPHPAGPFSDLAASFHHEWGLAPAQVMATRRQEELAALAILAVDSYWANLLDAIYRVPTAYNSRTTLFGNPLSDDPQRPPLRELITNLRARLPRATFYVPLGVGSHVDHQIVFQEAAAAGEPLAWYEDFPYVARTGALAERLRGIPTPLSSVCHSIDTTLEQKIAAALAYGSQISELAHSQLERAVSPAEAPAIMAEAIMAYAHSLQPPNGSYAERIWHRS